MVDGGICKTGNSIKLFNYAVFGNPVSHSVSPLIMAHFAKLHAQDLCYGRIQTDAAHFANQASLFLAQGGRGGNVTSPCKIAAFEFVDELTERAAIAGAVNTFWKQANGRTKGDNTDGLGFLDFLHQDLQLTLKDKRILILGAGGAVRGLLPILAQEEFQECVILNRSLDHAHALATAYARTRALPLEENFQGSFDLVIHALGNVFPKLHPANCQGAIVCHLSYAKFADEFLAWAKSAGARSVHNGFGMVLRQAEYGFEDWFGIHPHTTLSEMQEIIARAK